MAKSRHYQVVYAFPVKDKDGKLHRMTPRHAELVEDVLSPAQIKEHLAAGNLKDNGAVLDEPAAPKGGK